MVDRIAHHQSRRADGWTTIEAPRDLAGAILTPHAGASVLLVAQLAALGVDLSVAVGAELACAAPTTRAKLCACLLVDLAIDPSEEYGFDDEHDDDLPEPAEAAPGKPVCTALGTPPDGVEVWRVAERGHDDGDARHGVYIVARDGKQYRSIGTVNSHLGLARGSETSFELDVVEARAAGDAGYVWVEGVERDATFNAGESVTTETRVVTVCAWPAPPDARCPLQVPLAITTTASLEWEEPDALDEFRRSWGGDPPVVRTTTTIVEVRADGTAMVRLTSGKATDLLRNYLGAHALW
jgi:hypothetical protein